MQQKGLRTVDAAGELAPASKQEIDEVAYWLVERFFKDSFQALPGPTPNASPNASPNLNPNPKPTPNPTADPNPDPNPSPNPSLGAARPCAA